MVLSEYKNKVRGCWFGKCLAGAVGMPYEGVPFTVDLNEEELVLANVPNDDLELQLVWLEAVEKHGVRLTARDLGDIWLQRIPSGCDEYSIALFNMKRSVMPPASGYLNNFFCDGMGATIRSEIWALLFAGRPDAAGHFACFDAEVDHHGDGVLGEAFMAYAEAHAVEHSSIEKALRFAFDKMPQESRIRRQLQVVFDMYDNKTSDEDARAHLLLNYQTEPNFTDCVMNLMFIVNGLLRGKGDFIKTIFDIVSYGRDTDCTAATAGAFLGCVYGMEAFPEKYLNAVENELALSSFVSDIPNVPKTIDELVERTVSLNAKLQNELPQEEYSTYKPYTPAAGELPQLWKSTFLILDNDKHDVSKVKTTLAETGKVPEEYLKYVRTFDTPYLDLSSYGSVRRLSLLTFADAGELTIPPENLVFMACADVGLRVFMDDVRILNNHSRHKMIPAFHRVQGGAAFNYPMRRRERKLMHVELFHCEAPTRACVMFGNTDNDLCDEIKFTLEA